MHASSDLPEPPQDKPLIQEEAKPSIGSTSQTPNQALSESRIDDAPVPDRVLPLTLETRRKKKEESSPPQTETTARFQESSPMVDPSQPIKSGSKRKFSPDDDGFFSGPAQEDDEFQFSRPSHSPQAQSDAFDFLHNDGSPSKALACIKREPVKDGMMKRKVLEPSTYRNSAMSWCAPWKLRLTM